jgi:hypothetical protein
MGRHVNYADEQDRWLNKADKINRNNKKREIPLEDRDPGSLTLAEQFELARRRQKEQQLLKEKMTTAPKKEVRISHRRPK